MPVSKLSIDENATISELIDILEEHSQYGCALVFNKSEFSSLLTDGDVRRAFLAGMSISDKISEVINIKRQGPRPEPIFATLGTSRERLAEVFEIHNLRQILIKNEAGEVVDVITRPHSKPKLETQLPYPKEFDALLMAGGFGTRLHPLTQNTPKPMLKIAGIPILERSVRALVEHGVSRIFISTHYLAEQVTEHFGDGSKFGVEVHYLHETEPLGTGGCLKLLPKIDRELLVMNGDIYTDLNFTMFLMHHLRAKNAATIGTQTYSINVPYGVIDVASDQVVAFREKPTLNMMVNGGIYFLSPKNLSAIDDFDGPFTLPDYVEKLRAIKLAVGVFPIYENWMDIGTIEDFEKATKFLSDENSK